MTLLTNYTNIPLLHMLSNKNQLKSPAPLRRGFSFARFRFALIFNIQAVKTAFFFDMCYILTTAQNAIQSRTEPHRAKQRTPHHPNRRQNRTTSSTGNRSEASQGATDREHTRTPQELRSTAASLNACTIGAKARRIKQATAEAVPLMLSDRPAANRNRQILL